MWFGGSGRRGRVCRRGVFYWRGGFLMVLDYEKEIYSFCFYFFCLFNGGDNRIYFKGLWGGLNEIIY